MKLIEDIKNFIKSIYYDKPDSYHNPDADLAMVIEYSNAVLKKVEELANLVETIAIKIEKLKNKFDFYEKCINAMEKDAIIHTLEFCEKYSDKKYTGDRTNIKECQTFIDENLNEAEKNL